ncbi:DUF6063 family protein [Salipaludibacillus sp. HK11]|uniref:DUF6063 family protein n=1 Tax=Salipaludibacillus sp. HK11 TaxID=3394320 RepID=UPI0039FD566E
MNVKHKSVIEAFDIYNDLSRKGYVESDKLQLYLADDEIRNLLEDFINKVECEAVVAGEKLYMIPRTKLSPFHVDNNYLKKTYLGTKATNADLYLLYFATIIFIGEFYDSYHSQEATRNFLPLDEWVEKVNERINTFRDHPEEKLKQWEQEYAFHWTAIINKWEAMDDLKETAKKQAGNTISRLSFLDTAKRFLIDQEIVEEIGNGELTLTEKAKTIVQRFFMEAGYNQDILSFIYSVDLTEKEE